VVAQHMQLELELVAEPTIWSQGVFKPSGTTLASLTMQARKFDFAVLVLTPDDLLIKREKQTPFPRDNVLFELGLFVGTLGTERTFIVYCRDEAIELPSDLAGITPVTFARRADGNLQAALGPVCTKIKMAMLERGRRVLHPQEQVPARKLVLHYISDVELGHLRHLDGRAPFQYTLAPSFQGELRRLRDLGLIRTLPHRTVGKMPAEGNAREHVEITEEGQAYLAMRKRIENSESTIELSETQLRRSEP